MSMPKSALPYRPIHEDAMAPLAGVPLRARAAKPWLPDEQIGMVLPVRGASGQKKGVTRADVAVAEREGEGFSVVKGRSRQKSAARPAPVTKVYEDEELEVEEREETHPLDEEEEESPFTAQSFSSVRRRASVTGDARWTTTQQYPGRSSALTHAGRAQVITGVQRPARHRIHWMLVLGAGMVLMALLYTAIFWVSVGVLNLYNVAHYGPTHTETLDTKLGGEPGHIIATNVHGTIYVTIIEEQPGGKSTITTYTGPHPIPSAWGGDQASLDGIVVTLDVEPVQGSALPDISVHMIGNLDYWHLYDRPTATFLLIPADKTGKYKVTL